MVPLHLLINVLNTSQVICFVKTLYCVLRLHHIRVIWIWIVGQIVGAHMVGALVTKVAEVFNVARSTVSKILREYSNSGKDKSKSKHGWKCALSKHDSQSLKRNAMKNKKRTVAKMTVVVNVALTKSVSIQTIWRRLHKVFFFFLDELQFKSLMLVSRMPLKEKNGVKFIKCGVHQWKRFIWSNEYCFTLFPTSERVYV